MKQFFLGAMFAFVLAAPVAAQNLVTNDGFEDGLNGWTQVGNFGTGYNYVTCPGDCAMQEGNFQEQGLAGISQQLATTAGDYYQISLDWMATGVNDTSGLQFDIFWNGGLVGQILGDNYIGVYTPLSYTVAGIGNDLLTIEGFSSSGYNRFDHVSVVHTDAPPPNAAVPEPASWALMLGGFALVGGVLRTRRRSVAFI
ncbi:MAG TPA: PEPxxWA-CTERM sorting domain-containing protein [Sphingomonas sp.]|uniref:PEPxxWA-CTERM sorting domain-containing protein n=1 Tax=Sphingomonas sp. TaxID=28214 RepID=UPI002C4E8E78|nr:PEPxxWA-CTERM sorting domain-containing protein [Sphingomonas sp.]HMI20661.1 PEPxxWA-CTERM sorting domain-containing protein [Sphingomonas sp.]